VQRCREIVPEDQWIQDSPSTEDVPTGSEPISEATSFEFTRVELKSGIDTLFDGTYYSIVSHLLHFVPGFTRPLPIPIDSLETIGVIFVL
jgi:hypothetical protein